MVYEMKGNYDPEYLCRSNYASFEESQWPRHLRAKVNESRERYSQYIDSDIIRSQDISTFNKTWLLKALSLVN